MKIKDVDTELKIFEEALMAQTGSTEKGDYRTGNKIMIGSLTL